MSTPTIPPTHAANEPEPPKPRPPRTDRDFASHVPDARQHVADERQDEPLPATEPVESELVTLRKLVQETTTTVAGGRVYPQSLHVVGYLSMLGRLQSATQGAESNGGHESATGAQPSDAASVASEAYPVIHVVSEANTSGTVFRVDASRTVAAADLTDTPAADPVAAAVAPPLRFARRSLRISGSTVFLRDFTMNAVEARAMLDTIRESFPGDVTITAAVFNGKTYAMQ